MLLAQPYFDMTHAGLFRCGYKLSRSSCRGCSSISTVSPHSVCFHCPAACLTLNGRAISLVSDGRIGLLSSSMFGGMMFGAVGWGTCELSPSPLASHPMSHSAHTRFGPPGTDGGVQRYPIPHFRIWSRRVSRQHIPASMRSTVSARQCRGCK